MKINKQLQVSFLNGRYTNGKNKRFKHKYQAPYQYSPYWLF